MKRKLDELFDDMYNAEFDMALNLFCISLISSDNLWNKEKCMEAKDKVLQFEQFLIKQEDSDKKKSFLEFCENAYSIINRECELICREEEISALSLEWNVYREDVNKNKIIVYNIFDFSYFWNAVKKILIDCATKEEVSKNLAGAINRYFCGFAEWETVIGPFIRNFEKEAIKIDVYDQVKNNWPIFLDYVWSFHPNAKAGEVYGFKNKEEI